MINWSTVEAMQAPATGNATDSDRERWWASFYRSDPDRARLALFFESAMTAHPVHREAGSGAHVCRCGLIATYCPIQRAAVRCGLINPEALPWQPLTEDLPAPGTSHGHRTWRSA